MRDRPIDPSYGTSNPGADDLSSEIAVSIGHDADERVTCKRVCGSRYRCNWWAPSSATGYDNPTMNGLTVTTHHVRCSRFLNVTKTETGLLIQDCSRAAGHEG